MDNISILHPIISRVRRDAYAVKRKDKGPACVRKPFTDEHLEQHIKGIKSYGVYPIAAGSSEVSLALLDLDSHKGETDWSAMIEAARLVSEELEKYGLITIPWRSSGGHGIHLYMLWDNPQDAYSVRELLRKALEEVGFKSGTGGVATKQIEIFPKQSEVAEGRMGSMFILPLAGQSLPIDRENWGIKERNTESSIEWPTSKDVPIVSRPVAKPRPTGLEYNSELKRIRAMLEHICCEDYDIWIKVGLALHYETDGSFEALILWDEWSENAHNYVSYEDLEYRWNGFTHNLNNPATIGSIKKLAREGGWVENIIEEFEDLEFSENPNKIIEELSQLDPIEYDRQRKPVADKLGIRISTLDGKINKLIEERLQSEQEECTLAASIKPWPEPVDSKSVLEEIYNVIGRFIVCNENTKVAASLWITFTWFIDNVQVAPIAMITAPEKRCGKSQLLSLISKMAYRPLMASNITPAAIFRVIEDRRPTLLIDEADTFMDDKSSELGGIINSGHTRDTAFVIRVCGEEFEVKQFSTWGPKAIAGIGRRTETIEDRSINLQLRRKLPNEKVERLRYAEPGLFESISRKLARLAQDHGVDIEKMRPTLPDELHDRAQDNWEPLLSIADFASEEWGERARKAAIEISGAEQEVPSIATELLKDIKYIFENLGVPNMHTVDLIVELCMDDEKPWQSFNKDKRINARQLAKLLKDFGLSSKNIKINGDVRKGYSKFDFEDAFARYIPDISAVPLKPLPNKDIMVADDETSSATNSTSATKNPLPTVNGSETADNYDDLC